MIGKLKGQRKYEMTLNSTTSSIYTLFSWKRRKTKRKTSLEAPRVPDVVAIETTAFYWILIYRVSIKNISLNLFFLSERNFWLLLLAISGLCSTLQYARWFIVWTLLRPILFWYALYGWWLWEINYERNPKNVTRWGDWRKKVLSDGRMSFQR